MSKGRYMLLRRTGSPLAGPVIAQLPMTICAPINRPRRCFAYRNQAGFSLLEVVVTLAILFVLMVSAIGGYEYFQTSRAVRTGAENLRSAFVAARSFAVSNNANYRVVLQLREPISGKPSVTYWIDEIFPSSVASANPFPAVPEQAKLAKITTPEAMAPGVSVFDVFAQDTTATASTISYAVIRFFKDGSCDPAEIRLVDEGAPNAAQAPKVYTLRLSPATGQPRVIADVRR